jgi:hypothetical protein
VSRHAGRGGKPSLQLRDELLLLGRLLDLGEAVEVGIRGEFGRHRTFRAEKQESHLLETRFAFSGEQTRPPVSAGKIFSGKESFSK